LVGLAAGPIDDGATANYKMRLLRHDPNLLRALESENIVILFCYLGKSTTTSGQSAITLMRYVSRTRVAGDDDAGIAA
jgi:hypothetical protein